MLHLDQRLAIENIREAVGRIWARPLHRYYTDHTVTHSERVIALLDGLTAGMITTDKRLAPGEVFVLLAAAYLHDIGMQNERFADGDLNQIRNAHNEQTAEMIYAVFEDPANALAISIARDPALVEAVALVARGHRKADLSAAEYDPFVHGGETLRLRLLAALLRFGDELDIDHRRVDLEMIKLMKLPLDSQLHWWKCHYVSGVSIEDEYIKIAYRFPQVRPDYETFIVPLVEGDIRSKLSDLEEIFRASAIKVAVGKSSVRLMRLVQEMPAEVERLARKDEGGGSRPACTRGAGTGELVEGMKAEGHKKQNAEDEGREVDSKKRTTGSKQRETRNEQPATIFDQRGQSVGTQINVAGNYVDQRQGASPVQKPETPRFGAFKRKNMEARLEALMADYEAASTQLRDAVDEVTRTRLGRKLETLAQEIQQLEDELAALG